MTIAESLDAILEAKGSLVDVINAEGADLNDRPPIADLTPALMALLSNAAGGLPSPFPQLTPLVPTIPNTRLYSAPVYTTSGAFAYGTTGLAGTPWVASCQVRAADPRLIGGNIIWQAGGIAYTEDMPLTSTWQTLTSTPFAAGAKIIGLRMRNAPGGGVSGTVGGGGPLVHLRGFKITAT